MTEYKSLNYPGGKLEKDRLSDQSASSGADGPARNADQGTGSQVTCVCGEKFYDEQCFVSHFRSCSAVARVPATPGFDELALAITDDMEKTQKVIRDFDDGGDIDDESDDYLAGVLDGLDSAMKLLDEIRQTNKTNRT